MFLKLVGIPYFPITLIKCQAEKSDRVCSHEGLTAYPVLLLKLRTENTLFRAHFQTRVLVFGIAPTVSSARLHIVLNLADSIHIYGDVLSARVVPNRLWHC